MSGPYNDEEFEKIKINYSTGDYGVISRLIATVDHWKEKASKRSLSDGEEIDAAYAQIDDEVCLKNKPKEENDKLKEKLRIATEECWKPR